MFTINKISAINTLVTYDYSVGESIKKFFNPKETFYAKYDVDISDVPESILVIPLLANVITISWFAGFDIYVDELDAVFYESLKNIKLEFIRNYPQLKEVKSELYCKKIVTNNFPTTKAAMLFSGGVDAYATYFRTSSNRQLDLVTILGADVKVDDAKQWNTVVTLNEKEPILKNSLKYYIEANLRTFYTYQVDQLLPDLAWWGKVQHGLALNCLLAPLSYKNGYETIFIASSYTDNIEISWGSTPQIDNQIQWANVSVIHDGYELQRQEKVSQIVSEINKNNSKLNLRVCYAEINNGINCGKCEKCYRTIFGILLSDGNPNNFGFDINSTVYEEVLTKFSDGFYSKGSQYFWWEINEKLKQNKPFFVFEDKEKETKKLIQISKLIDNNIAKGYRKGSKLDRIKHTIQNKFPTLFKHYLRFRQRKLIAAQNKTTI